MVCSDCGDDDPIAQTCTCGAKYCITCVEESSACHYCDRPLPLHSTLDIRNDAYCPSFPEQCPTCSKNKSNCRRFHWLIKYIDNQCRELFDSGEKELANKIHSSLFWLDYESSTNNWNECYSHLGRIRSAVGLSRHYLLERLCDKLNQQYFLLQKISKSGYVYS